MQVDSFPAELRGKPRQTFTYLIKENKPLYDKSALKINREKINHLRDITETTVIYVGKELNLITYTKMQDFKGKLKLLEKNIEKMFDFGNSRVFLKRDSKKQSL